MDNHFFFSYNGNKRTEYKYIKDYLNFEGIKNIFESFCGTSAISFMIWKEHKEKFNYYLNDNDTNLIFLYNYYKNNDINDIYKELNFIKNSINCKEDYDKLKNEINFNKKNFICTDDNIIKYLFFNKCYSIRPGNYRVSKTNLKYKNELLLFIEFIKSPYVFISSNNWDNNFEDNEKNLYIFDPPYILSDNNFYSNLNKNINIYEYFFNNKMNNFKCKILFILEYNWVITFLFKDFIKFMYEKTYSVSKIKTKHCIISNY